jgi:alcohol dehydrogenase class IV
MVKPFQFSRLPLIYFGPGRLKLLPGLIRKFGNKVILVTDQKSFTGSDFADQLFVSLKGSGIKLHHVVIPGEPSPEMIDSATRAVKDSQIDAVIGIGGGSVVDAGKAISAMMYRDESVRDYLEGVGTMEHPGTKLPYIAIPTTSGTGSEATRNAVISETGKNGFKKSLRHENFVPDTAIVDPILTITCPRDVTAASGMDCFTQLVESYLSTKAVEFTDALALSGLAAVRSSLFRCYTDGTDIEARSDMSYAALTSGICLANAGLGAVHGFASSIGGIYKIPHGVICGTLMAEANGVNVRVLRDRNNLPAVKKYSVLGRLFTGETDKPDDYYIDAFIGYLKELTDNLKLPLLRQYGVDEDDIPLICKTTDIKNNPVDLSVDDLMEIIYRRF